MAGIGSLLAALLLVFALVLLARLVVDWTATLAGAPLPGGVRDRLTVAARALTEPVLAPLRGILPLLRLGPVALDLALPVLFLAVVLVGVDPSRPSHTPGPESPHRTSPTRSWPAWTRTTG